jgi:hypothetical protein
MVQYAILGYAVRCGTVLSPPAPPASPASDFQRPPHHLIVLLQLVLAVDQQLQVVLPVSTVHWMLEGVGELLEEAVGGGLAVLLPDLGKRHIKMIIFSISITLTVLGVL